MKLKIFFMIIILVSTGCARKEIKEPKKETAKPAVIEVKKEQITQGWTGNDTYTVKASAENLEKAKDKAKHQILQDIVKVRMQNDSRYTDITKIVKEFEKPLKEGRVISEEKTEKGIDIYFQIKDEGLKEKFEKK